MKSNGVASSNGAAKNNGKQKTTAKKTQAQNGSVKTSSKAAQGLREFFEDSLKDIYWAEKALVKAIPKMAKNAESDELVSALEEHLSVTEGQVTRIEKVFERLGKTARAKKCEAMEGLIKEGESIMEETEAGVVRDAGIIAASQKIEHYEIASYGTLSAFAKILGEDKVAGMLEESLAEEKDADNILTRVAETSVNIAAAEGEEEYQEEGVQESSSKTK